MLWSIFDIFMATTTADISYHYPYFGEKTKSNPAQEVPRLDFFGFESMITTENRRNQVSLTLHYSRSVALRHPSVLKVRELGCDVGQGGDMRRLTFFRNAQVCSLMKEN